jgi:hypothetical protein
MMSEAIEKFKIHFDGALLEDLRAAFRDECDWRAQEARLNRESRHGGV